MNCPGVTECAYLRGGDEVVCSEICKTGPGLPEDFIKFCRAFKQELENAGGDLKIAEARMTKAYSETDEDAGDLRLAEEAQARVGAGRPTVPAEEVYKKLGLTSDSPEVPILSLVPRLEAQIAAREAPATPVPPPVDEEMLALLNEVTAMVMAGQLNGLVFMAESKEPEGEGYIVRWSNALSLSRRLGLLELAKAQQLSDIPWQDEE